MNNVLAFTVQQMTEPCRVYISDFPGGLPANEKEKIKAKRPHPQSCPAHAAALAAHAKRYTVDRPCSKCGGFERYTSGRQCVDCHRDAARRSAKTCYVARYGEQVLRHREMRETAMASRKAADAAGEMFYSQAVPCVKCSSTVRYTKNNRCKHCADVYQSKLKQKRGY